MSKDLQTSGGPKRIDWEIPGAATDDEVRENVRAMRAEIYGGAEPRVFVRESNVPISATSKALRYLDNLLEVDDQPAMRNALNAAGWLLWR